MAFTWVSTIGWFFSASRSLRILFVFGSNVVDIAEIFAPRIAAHYRLEPHPDGNVVVVTTADGKEAHYGVDGRVRMNHFMLGVPLLGVPANAPGPPCPAVPVDARNARLAQTAAAEAGYGLRVTELMGNCAIDTMALLLGAPRTLAGFRALRFALRTSMLATADSKIWQDAFESCQEDDGEAVVALPHGKGVGGPPPLPPPAPKPTAGAAAKAAKTRLWRGGKAVPRTAPAPIGAGSGCLGVGEARPAEPLALDVSALEAIVPKPMEKVTSFSDYIKALPAEQKLAVCKSYDTFLFTERKWLLANPRVQNRIEKQSKIKTYRTHYMRHRVAMGFGYLEWRKTEEGKNARDHLKAYCKIMHKYEDGVVPKKDKVLLARSIKEAQKQGETGYNQAAGGRRGVKRTMASAKRPDALRIRATLQNQARKGGPLDEMLWDWFVDMRGSIAYNLPPKYFMKQAVLFADMIVQCMAKTGEYIEMPKLKGEAGRIWCHRWCRNRNVNLRAVNRRYKASKDVLRLRLRAMWRNVIVVRALFRIAFGKELIFFWARPKRRPHERSGLEVQKNIGDSRGSRSEIESQPRGDPCSDFVHDDCHQL